MKLQFITKLFFTLVIFSAAASNIYAADGQTQAVEQLRKEIARSIAQKNASPVRTVLQRYKIRGVNTFSGQKKDDESYEILNYLPKNRPALVTPGEWRALRKSPVAIDDSENNSASFSLLDLDEDGLRDLIVETYLGGTGLYSYVHVYRRKGGQFIADETEPVAENSANRGTPLYSINGRGSDQEAEWVRINGRVYLAYRNGVFGKDELSLERVFSKPADKLKGLIVEYEYRHDLPSRQKINEKVVVLEPEFHAALQKGLKQFQIKYKNGSENDFGKCPVSQNLSAEERENYASSWFDPPHYSFEVVAEFPIFEKDRCYMARFINFWDGFSVKNKFIPTSLWLRREPGGAQEEYNVESIRIPGGVKIVDLEYRTDGDI